MPVPVALYDACVLYPAPLRDLLMHLALTDLFRAKWTRIIHAEWMRGVLANRPDLTRAQLERTRGLMDAHVRDCLVEGFENLIPALYLPDPDDRHVLAAAIHARADVIVTFDLGGFPSDVLARHDLQARHPDAFVTQLLDRAPEAVCAAVRRHRQSLRNPPRTVEEYLATLERQSLAQTTARLRRLADRI